MSRLNAAQSERPAGTDAGGSAWAPREPAQRVLMALKTHGPLAAARIGEIVGTTAEAARQQLARLEAEGLVAASSAPAGVGRPVRVFALTGKGESRFPDAHGALTVQLLGLIRRELGEAALERIIAARGADTIRGYLTALRPQSALEERVAALARLRSDEGYMASFWREDAETLVLEERHCPIGAAAGDCQGFCQAELEVFRAVLGPDAEIERREHLLSGGHRCAYAIRTHRSTPAPRAHR